MDEFKKKILGDIINEPSILSFDDDINVQEVNEEEILQLQETNKKYASGLRDKISQKVNSGAASSSQQNYDIDDEASDDDTPEFGNDSEDVAMMKKKLGLDGRGGYRTRINIKRDHKFRPIDKPSGMTEAELMMFKKIVAPGMIASMEIPKQAPKVDFTFIEDELEDDDDVYNREVTEEDETRENRRLMEIIMSMQSTFDIGRSEKQIKKIIEDERYISRQERKKDKKYDTYHDLKKLDALHMFSVEWRNALLNDQNVETPFIYLQSLHTAGVGGIPYRFKPAVYFLEALGMTVTIIGETTDSCRYRAFFSGKQFHTATDDEITMLKEMIKEKEKNKPRKIPESGSAAQTSYQPPPNSYQEMMMQKTGERGIESLKRAQRQAKEHEKPVNLFASAPHVPTEKEKEKKKKERIMRMEMQLGKNVEIEDSDDEDQDSDEEDGTSIASSSVVGDNYDQFLGGFTREMISSLEESAKFLDMKSIDSLAKKQTELSAWIEKRLCIDIVVIPGLNSSSMVDEKIERQLLFVFNLVSQNPYTFYLMNVGKEERNAALTIRD